MAYQKIGKPFIENTFNKHSGTPCVKIYQIVQHPTQGQLKQQLAYFDGVNAEAQAEECLLNMNKGI